MAKAIKMILFSLLLIQAAEVFSQDSLVIADDKLVINDILISGNKVTHESVILRELVFTPGDTIYKMQLLQALQRSKENVMNLSLFNFVFLNVKHLGNNFIDVTVEVTERWYIWPVPILEYADRNFHTFIKNWDWQKINYGAWLKWNNFRGRNELLTGKIRLGYIKEYALAYSKPNMGKRQAHGVSVGFNANHQNEVFIATVNNRPLEYEPLDIPAQTRLNAFAKYTYRRKLYTTHSLRFEYFDYKVSDSVAIVNPNYLGDGAARQNFFMLTYNFDYDIRDSKIYPLEGFNVRFKVEQIGLGMVPEFNYRILRLTGILLFHQKIVNRIYFYNATKARYTSEKILPYFLNKSLGYYENLRGYEPYVIDGSDYVLSLYNFKIEVLKPNTFTIPYLGIEQFSKVHYAVYANVFADAGYVSNDFPNPTNTLVNTWQFSTGVSIDLVTYYDRVFSFGYVVNRYGEHGVFFQIETPFLRW